MGVYPPSWCTQMENTSVRGVRSDVARKTCGRGVDAQRMRNRNPGDHIGRIGGWGWPRCALQLPGLIAAAPIEWPHKVINKNYINSSIASALPLALDTSQQKNHGNSNIDKCVYPSHIYIWKKRKNVGTLYEAMTSVHWSPFHISWEKKIREGEMGKFGTLYDTHRLGWINQSIK